MNHLYYGDNLQILREHIKDESIDLIYLDPPFNSKRDYNLLFKSHKDMTVRRKFTAFGDTGGIRPSGSSMSCSTNRNTDVAEMLRALRAFLRENDMMASQPLDLSFLRALQ